MKQLFNIILVTSLCGFQMAYAASVQDIDKNIQQLGFDKYFQELKRNRPDHRVKIAVLDYGFDGYEDEMNYTIPIQTVYKQRDAGDYQPVDNKHGLVMAQIITQYMTKDYSNWRFAPIIYLYKADGYSNFSWAIDDAIANEVDVILHSMVIEYGSNYDGRGFYNSLVNRASDAGILWINSAGNFGLTTYNSNVIIGDNGWVQLNDLPNNALPVECKLPKKSKVKNCNIRVVLSWDDFKNRPHIGTKKDLDLYLFDGNFESSIQSALSQIPEDDPRMNKEGFTLYPREIIETTIAEGTSYIKVRARGDAFASSDKLRVTADGDNIVFPHRDENESLLNPADNPNVLTVGENSERSSRSKSLAKPELVAPSEVLGDDGRIYKGSSNAAAVVAAGVALMKLINKNLDKDSIVELATNSAGGTPNIPGIKEVLGRPRVPMILTPHPQGPVPIELERYHSFIQSDRYFEEEEPKQDRRPRYNDNYEYTDKEAPPEYSTGETTDLPPMPESFPIPTKSLGFGTPPNAPGCFPPADVRQVDPCVVLDFVVKTRGILVHSTQGLKIAVTYDPAILLPLDARTPFMKRVNARENYNDVVAIFPVDDYPFRIFPRNVPPPPGAIEIFRIPPNEFVCKIPDWDFLMMEREDVRRQLYAQNAYGPRNTRLPLNCNPQYSLESLNVPVSDWSIQPVLQHTPYIGPVAPAPIDPRMQQRPFAGPERKYGEPKDGPQFRLPQPSEVQE